MRNVEEEVANRDVEAVDAVAVDKAVAVSNAAASEVGDKLVVVAQNIVDEAVRRARSRHPH